MKLTFLPIYKIFLSFSFFCLIFLASCSQEKCDKVPGLAPLLHPGKVILLGEIHGTQEAPMKVAEMACQALEQKLAVTIGLELPRVDQLQIEAYLQSNGASSARDKLLAVNFWGRDYQDGRASQAMLGLLDTIRQLKAEGKDIDVVCIDEPSFEDRDFAMAEVVVAAITKAPARFYLVLTGNMHNIILENASSMGSIVAPTMKKGRVISLNLSYAGGSAWVCMSEGCGPFQMGGRGGTEKGIFLNSDMPEYDGILGVDSIHASRPARELKGK